MKNILILTVIIVLTFIPSFVAGFLVGFNKSTEISTAGPPEKLFTIEELPTARQPAETASSTESDDPEPAHEPQSETVICTDDCPLIERQ